jgi:peptidoglycan biosynthesis protein MviN/MurJ (putative lipid II flippase)
VTTIGDIPLWAGIAAIVIILFGLILGPIFWAGLYWLGISTIAAGLATVAYQVLVRLSDGYWLGITGDGSASSSNGIIPWIVALPIGLGLVLLGSGLGWVGIVGQAAVRRREARKTHNA